MTRVSVQALPPNTQADAGTHLEARGVVPQCIATSPPDAPQEGADVNNGAQDEPHEGHSPVWCAPGGWGGGGTHREHSSAHHAM